MIRYLLKKRNNSPVPEQPQEPVKPQRIVEIPFCELEIVKKSCAKRNIYVILLPCKGWPTLKKAMFRQRFKFNFVMI